MINDIVYLYLISPLHTGGTTQEGNLLGIARESHTNLPYIPSSTIRGRLRASVTGEMRSQLFGTDLKDTQQLEQGNIWIGDASILWLPVPSLSHGVVWISCPMLLQRWTRFNSGVTKIPTEYSSNLANTTRVYLKDAIVDKLQPWQDWRSFIPQVTETSSIKQVIVFPNQHFATLTQMSLWRQVKVKLDEHKSVEGGFRDEEAIPPDTLMYFPWGTTSQANGTAQQSHDDFENLLHGNSILQIGGQESLGRGFVQQWMSTSTK